MKPTEICFLSECSFANWRSRLISAPLPNGLVIDAWNATVGASFDRCFSHAAVTRVGTRSHLLSRNTRCLWLASFLRNASACGARVPIGSRASRTATTTSDESITLKSSPRIRRDWPASKM